MATRSQETNAGSPHNAGPRELTDFDVRLQEMDACGAFDHHPTLKVALGHLGEGLPFWTRRTDNRYSWTYQAAGKALGMIELEQTPSEYLRRNFAVTSSRSASDASVTTASFSPLTSL